jgi:hypothetical protein
MLIAKSITEICSDALLLSGKSHGRRLTEDWISFNSRGQVGVSNESSTNFNAGNTIYIHLFYNFLATIDRCSSLAGALI